MTQKQKRVKAHSPRIVGVHGVVGLPPPALLTAIFRDVRAPQSNKFFSAPSLPAPVFVVLIGARTRLRFGAL